MARRTIVLSRCIAPRRLMTWLVLHPLVTHNKKRAVQSIKSKLRVIVRHFIPIPFVSVCGGHKHRIARKSCTKLWSTFAVHLAFVFALVASLVPVVLQKVRRNLKMR
jgi:hypothetical protein